VPEWFHSRVVNTVGDVMNNPWEHARIEKVEATMTVRYERDTWRLRGVELLDPVVDAGESARVRVHLVPFIGAEVTRVLEVKLPAELAGKDVDVEVVPGYDVTPELASPDSLDELLANEPKQSVNPRSLVLQYRVPAQGLAYRGRVTPRLPLFTLDALRPTSSDAGPESFQTWVRTVVPVDRFVEGHDKVRVKVRAVVR
jgi:hypothetical protein